MRTKILSFLLLGALVGVTSSCEDFLDIQNYTEKNTSNYPETLTDAEQIITAIYNNLNIVCATPAPSYLMYAELASDDRLGGGGANDQLMQAIDMLLFYTGQTHQQFWKDRYIGVQRANNALQTLPICQGYESEAQMNQMLGEAHFLRAFYYYELASMFENIPLQLTPIAEELPQATPDETWGQIIYDLKQAIELMPAEKTPAARAGHVDKYVAEAMMARAFLFYTGFYNKTEVVLPNEAGTVTKANVISWIDDCVNNSGYTLVGDFRNLWAYTNRLTVDDYEYTKDVIGVDGKPLAWVENDQAANPESMFAIKFSMFASWGTTIGFSNGFALFFGPREFNQNVGQSFPFGAGWGAGPVAPNLWNDWIAAEPKDLRRQASIADVNAEMTGEDHTWKFGFGSGSVGNSWIQETQYYAKKTGPVQSKRAPGDYAATFEVDMYGYANDMQLANIHDLMLIRFADALLMQSELKEDVTGINRVRARAGLEPIAAYSLQALQNERRWELAFEGVRWNDMRRWGIAAEALAKQENVVVANNAVVGMNTRHGAGY
ncbi:MAG: RagB/SusD family nutrient uptake outer membrane protein, partial [Prevotellaceae bacterium]|nr:RagB/SusD family nutrient uptake outer membrane protein [Prevotellaceae bacterium]